MGWIEETTTRKISFDELPEHIKKMYRESERKLTMDSEVRELSYDEIPEWAKQTVK